jgi:Icc-related predicted phosphoesterase
MMQDGKVKILCMSDLHGCVNYSRLADVAIRKKVDVVAIAGDIETSFIGVAHERHFEREFLGMCKKMMFHGIEVVATPGNHDSFLREELGNRRKPFAENLHILVDRCETVCGLKFYGTPWVPFINGQWCWERADNRLAEKFDLIPSGIDILVCHTPPEGIGEEEMFDVSLQHNRIYWKHFGSKSLREAILRCRPRCVVCGHIHSGDHRLNRVGDSALINCSLIDERYQQAYKPAEIVIESNTSITGGSVKMIFKTEGVKKWETI